MSQARRANGIALATQESLDPFGRGARPALGAANVSNEFNQSITLLISRLKKRAT
jgi:hypothetical protein